MAIDGDKLIAVEVPKDVWKQLKIIGIERDMTIVAVIREILCKSMAKKLTAVDNKVSNL